VEVEGIDDDDQCLLWPRWMQILAIFLACIVGLVVLVFVVRFLRWIIRGLRGFNSRMAYGRPKKKRR